MLSAKGFKKVYNLSGGIRAWNKEVAIGPQDMGLELFSGDESAEDTIVTGFGLEQGLREFYLNSKNRVANDDAAQLFAKLAEIEIRHQEFLVSLYQEVTGKSVSMEEFADKIVTPAMEGGLTTEEYLRRFNSNLESTEDILDLALSIEAQALDLYQRAAERAADEKIKSVLQKIADEERAHIASLANYIDTM